MTQQRDDRSAGGSLEDESVEELLRAVGAREEPAADVSDAVRAAVHAEWRTMLAQRAQRRRRYVFGMAASVAFALVAAFVGLRFLGLAGPAATIALIDGRLPRQTQSAALGVYRAGDAVEVGDALHTDARTRVALDVGSGVSVRLDNSTSVRVAARDRLVLSAGAVYVDAAPAARRRSMLVIETRAGDLRHLGTQYQVRQGARAVEISVREGRIELLSAGGQTLAGAGERLRVAADGEIERTMIAPTDPDWDWAAETAPLFDIEDRTLDAFLGWAARETGRRLMYANDRARRTAESVQLRGSIAGLTPHAALDVVLSTTELRRAANDESILIAQARAIDSAAEERPKP